MIELTIEQIEKAERLLAHVPREVPKVIARAINRAAESAKTEAARQVREKYYIKYKEVTSTMKIHKATSADLSAAVISRDTRRELINFRVNPKVPRHAKPPAVLRVAVKKDGLKDLPRAFVAKGSSSGKLHVLQRVGKERYPLHIKYGPSVPQMLDNREVYEVVEEKAVEVLDKRLDHEINRILEG